MLARNNLTIKYINGEKNISADVLSRNPEFKDVCEKRERQLGKSNPMVAAVTTMRPAYADLTAFLKRVEEGYTTDPQWQDVTEKELDKELDGTSHSFLKMEIQGATVWYRVTADDDLPPTLVIPKDRGLRDMIIKEHHEPTTIGHREGAEVVRRMRMSYWWSGMEAEALAYTKACTTCNQNKDASKVAGEMSEKAHIPFRPWDSVVMDFCGPYHTPKTGKGQAAAPNSVLVVACRLTKMAHFIPCRDDMTAQDLADLFVDEVVRLHGIALDYRSDRDKLFRSAFWERVWSRVGTTLSMSTAYRHQTAGQAERAIQELRKYLAIYTKDHAEWVENIRLAEFAYNCATNSSTGCAPFELNYGFRPREIGGLIAPGSVHGLPQNERNAKRNADSWLEDLTNRIESAKNKLVEAHSKMKEQYDKKRTKTKDKGQNVVFAQKGSSVYLSTKDMKNISTVARASGGQEGAIEPKWLPRYLGPYEVLEVCGGDKLNRRLKLPRDLHSRLGADTFHVSKLKAASTAGQTLDLSETIPPPTLKDGDDEQFYIEKIMGHVDDGPRGRKFLLKAVGFNDPKDYWFESENELENSQSLIEEYLRGSPRELVSTRKMARQLSTKRQYNSH